LINIALDAAAAKHGGKEIGLRVAGLPA